MNGELRHIPVLMTEVLQAFGPLEGKTVLDGTFGAGGYTRALLAAGAQVVALDRDPDAIRAGQPLVAEAGGRLSLHRCRFSSLVDFAPAGGLDGIVLDIGVSSMQIDEAERGFSFQKSGPLDMRMGQDGATAADVVNTLGVGDLARIFNFLGEEKKAGPIARAIVERRASEPFQTTRDLAGLIERVSPRRMKDKIHPATRVFQALRIFVNDELGELAAALFAAEQALKPGGRLVVVTFHSLEDRIVKRFLTERAGGTGGSRHLPMGAPVQPVFRLLNKSVVTAGEAEALANPRARSAKLRAAERTEAPALAPDLSLFGLPSLADIRALKER